ncbi:MAG TPA: biotin transporter BioY, partial [Thermoanaerobaculia bacterium]
MNETLTIPRLLNERVIRGSAVTNVMLVVAASAIIAIAAQIAISVPFSPVPLTMQPLAVLLVGVILGSKRGAAAAILYLLEGASGAPVFAQLHGGAVWLAGATAGYLWSYPFAAFVAGWFSEKNWGSTIAPAVAGMLVALGVIYLGGWSWLAVLTGARNAFVAGVAPFVIADVVKIAIAAALLPQAQRVIAKVT